MGIRDHPVAPRSPWQNAYVPVEQPTSWQSISRLPRPLALRAANELRGHPGAAADRAQIRTPACCWESLICSVAAADDEAKMRLRAFLENKTPPPRITIGTAGLLINDTLVEIDDRCVAEFPTGLPRAMET
jgi:hypothetical protein